MIKSKKARDYVKSFQQQCPNLGERIISKSQDVLVRITIFYASRRPDLDESVILDAMQGFIYENDRSVKEKHIFWALDRENPRAEIEVMVR